MSRGYGIPIPPVLHERYNFVLILFLPTPVIKGQGRHLEAAWATGGQWLSWRSVPSLSARGGKNPSRWTRLMSLVGTLYVLQKRPPILLSWSVERSRGLRAYPLVSPGNGPQPRVLARVGSCQERTATWKDRTSRGRAERTRAIRVSVPPVGYASLYLSPVENFQDPMVLPSFLSTSVTSDFNLGFLCL